MYNGGQDRDACVFSLRLKWSKYEQPHAGNKLEYCWHRFSDGINQTEASSWGWQISSFVKVLRRLFKFVDFLFTHRQNCLCTHSHTLAVCLYWNIWWWMLWVYISTDSSLIGLQDSITHRTNQWSPTMNAQTQHEKQGAGIELGCKEAWWGSGNSRQATEVCIVHHLGGLTVNCVEGYQLRNQKWTNVPRSRQEFEFVAALK